MLELSERGLSPFAVLLWSVLSCMWGICWFTFHKSVGSRFVTRAADSLAFSHISFYWPQNLFLMFGTCLQLPLHSQSSTLTSFIRHQSSPVIELWSFNLFGGVWAGVWWCVLSIADPYNELKSSGVLLHFRWIDAFDESFPFGMFRLELPANVASDVLRPSCESPSNRFSYRLWLSWSDMNLLSELLCWICWWSSMSPCCRPSSPPTRFGRKSSVMLLWIMNFCWLQLLAEKFSWRLKMAGKMLNCCESGETGLSPNDEEVLFTKLPLAAVQFCLKSNVNAMIIRVLDNSPREDDDERKSPSEKKLSKGNLFALFAVSHNRTVKELPESFCLS